MSFGITPRDYLTMLQEQHREYRADPLSLRKAIAVLMFANHISEHVFAAYARVDPAKVSDQRSEKSYREYMVGQKPELGVIRDLCDFSKHGPSLHRKTVAVTLRGQGALMLDQNDDGGMANSEGRDVAEGGGGSAPPSVQGWHADEHTHRRWERLYWGAYILLSAATAAGAVFSAIFAFSAYTEAQRQANAAWQQVTIAREAEHKQLRAYVAAKVGDLKGFEKSETATFHLQLDNSGQTPALDTVATGILFPRPYPLPDTMDLTIPYTPEKVDRGRGMTMSPRDNNLGLTLRREIDPALFDAAIEGKIARYYAFGTIRYRDIFAVEHWTHFCISFYGEGLKNWDLCPRYNNADTNEE
jgi:hypothetical protein